MLRCRKCAKDVHAGRLSKDLQLDHVATTSVAEDRRMTKAAATTYRGRMRGGRYLAFCAPRSSDMGAACAGHRGSLVDPSVRFPPTCRRRRPAGRLTASSRVLLVPGARRRPAAGRGRPSSPHRRCVVRKLSVADHRAGRSKSTLSPRTIYASTDRRRRRISSGPPPEAMRRGLVSFARRRPSLDPLEHR